MAVKKLNIMITLACIIALISMAVVLLVIYAELRTNQDKYLEKISQLQAEIQDIIIEQNKTIQANSEKNTSNVPSTEDKNSDPEANYQAITEKFALLEAKYQAITNQFSVLDQATKQNISALKTKDQETERKISAIEAKDQETEGKISALKTKDQETERKISAIEAKDQETERKISAIEDKDQVTEGKISAIEAKDQETEGKISTIETKDKETERKISAIEAKDQETERKISAIEAKDKVTEGKISAIETKDQVTEGKISAIEAKDQETERKISAIEDKDQETERKISAIEAKDQETEGKISAIETKDQVTEGKISAIEAKDQETERKISAIETKDKETEGKISAIEAKDQLTEGKISALETKQEQMQMPRPGDCEEIYASGKTNDGVYTIYPDNSPMQVYCEMSQTQGSIVIQKRTNGDLDYARMFQEYSDGFGDLKAEHWLGLSLMNRITATGRWKLRVELKSFQNETRYAEYSELKIGPAPGFQLLFDKSSYKGDIGDYLYYHHNMRFSSRDNDQDEWSGGSCSAHYGNSGWWFGDCYNAITTMMPYPSRAIVWGGSQKSATLKINKF